MSDTDQPFICYGESYPIAGGPLAMDAAMPTSQRDRSMYAQPKKPPARRLARDEEPMDYTALLAFLREKLNAEDLTKAADMLGVQVETTGMDRRHGASDAALDREEAALKMRHRVGHITEGALATGMRDIHRRRGPRTMATDGKPGETEAERTARMFPHANRLKY